MSTPVQHLRDRARQSLERLTDAANGRELQILTPQWVHPNKATEPLTQQERELVLRWQFLSTCVDAIDGIGVKASAAANEAFAAAYLRADDEIGPVLILVGPERNNVVFGEGGDRKLKPNEQAAVDRFLDAFEAYRIHLRQTVN